MTDLCPQRGVAGGVTWPIQDGDGDPVDLTGWTVKAQVRTDRRVSAALLLEMSVSIVGSSVVWLYGADESAGWPWESGFYDVILTDPDGVPRQVVDRGRVLCQPVVTDA